MKSIFNPTIILFIFLYTFTALPANTQQDICRFKKVIQNGWNDKNQTLNQRIINLGIHEIPRIIQNLHYPLKPDENQSQIPPFPKIIVNRDDYTKLFTYSKYLESQNKIDQVINTYTNAYQGLNSIQMTSFLPFIYFIALHSDINHYLHSSLKQHTFTKEKRKSLYQKLSPLLALNNQKLIETIKAERAIVQYYINITKVDGDYVIDEQHLEIFKKQWEFHEKKYYSEYMDAIQKGTLEKLIHKKKEERKSISIATHLKMKLLKLKLQLYHKLSINIDKEDYIALSDYTIRQTLLTNTKTIDYTAKDYFKLIKDNKKLLQQLKVNK